MKARRNEKKSLDTTGSIFSHGVLPSFIGFDVKKREKKERFAGKQEKSVEPNKYM